MSRGKASFKEGSVVPLITTIIPTYRRPKLLRRAIRSVLNQTYPNFRVCIYDNASGDETADVVAEFAKDDPRVKYYCHPENIGAGPNFLYGMERVDTLFFSFLSDDDVLLPAFYETAISELEKYPDAAFFAGSTIAMTEEGKVCDVPLLSWKREGYYTPPEGLFKMIGGHHPIWTGILFRREVIDNIGSLDLEVGAQSDLDYELRIAAHYPFIISKKPCAILVFHSSSYSMMANYNYIWPSWLKMISNLKEDERLSLDLRVRSEQMLTEHLIRSLFTIGIRSIKQKSFDNIHKATEILERYRHLNIKYTLLFGMARFCETFPLAYYLFDYYKSSRNYLKRSFLQNLQKQYGAYARFLAL